MGNASAILGVLYGSGAFAALWLAMYTPWPKTVGFIAIAFVQLSISAWYLNASALSGRVYANIESMEDEDTEIQGEG
jgi:hypothetical protein